MKRILTLVCLAALLSGCASRVTPETTSRFYETTSAQALKDAIPRAFVKAGYLTTKAKWEEEKTTVTTTDVSNPKALPSTATNEVKVYKYGAAQLSHDGSLYRCMKLGNAKIIPALPKAYVVEMQSVVVSCYQSIGKVSFAIDTDRPTYERFFKALDAVMKQSGKPIGIH